MLRRTNSRPKLDTVLGREISCLSGDSNFPSQSSPHWHSSLSWDAWFSFGFNHRVWQNQGTAGSSCIADTHTSLLLLCSNNPVFPWKSGLITHFRPVYWFPGRRSPKQPGGSLNFQFGETNVMSLSGAFFSWELRLENTTYSCEGRKQMFC